MKLIVGLGNPGKEYLKTRHNIGFMCLDNILGDVKWKEKFNSLFFEIKESDEKIIYLKPQTYMNLSGNSVAAFLNFYKIDIEDVLIIHDDLDLAVGDFRMKTDSGSGGHNGLNSIIECLGTKKFNRLKIGISNKKEIETKDYVLGMFTKKEEAEIKKVLDISQRIVNDFVKFGMNFAMNNVGDNK